MLFQNNGICNFDVPTGKLVSLAVCVCPFGYDGEQCELDLDGCVDNPCYVGVRCTEVVANDMIRFPAGFQCDPCPFGLIGDGTSCVGNSLIMSIWCNKTYHTMVYFKYYKRFFQMMMSVPYHGHVIKYARIYLGATLVHVTQDSY